MVVLTLAWLTSGIVREHCGDLEGSEVLAESHWTVVLWPPGPFAATNPDGHCMRNHLVREVLAYTGLWDLPPAKKQLEDHYGDQLEDTPEYSD